MQQSSKFFRLDNQVVYTMALLCVISIIVFAFRFTTTDECKPFEISFGTDSIFTGDVVQFTTTERSGKVYTWDFGDDSLIEKGSSKANHQYREARKYTVKVVIDGNCDKFQNITVYEREYDVPDLVQSDVPNIRFPKTAYVNEPVLFSDVSSSSNSWEWYFEGSPEVYARESNVQYYFSKPGRHRIDVKINKKHSITDWILIYPQPFVSSPNAQANGGGGGGGGGRPRRMDIPAKPESAPLGDDDEEPTSKEQTPAPNVNNKPAPPKVTPKVEEVKPKTAPDVSDRVFASYLHQFAEGTKTADEFGEYFCGKTNIPVLYNNKKYLFNEFCNELRKMKVKKIREIVVVSTKNQHNCILSFQVSISKKTMNPFD